MLTNDFKWIQNDGLPAPGGPLPLEQAFSDPSKLTTSHDLDLFLKGLSVEVQEDTDLKLVDGMRVALLDAFDIQLCPRPRPARLQHIPRSLWSAVRYNVR